MFSPREALFAVCDTGMFCSSLNDPFVVKDVPEGLLRIPGVMIVGGRISGNVTVGQQQLPALEYKAIYICRSNKCAKIIMANRR